MTRYEEFIEFRELLLKNILVSGKYSFVQKLKFSSIYCPFCGDIVEETDLMVGIITTELVNIKKEVAGTAIQTKERKIKFGCDDSVTVCHSACLGNMSIWTDPDIINEKNYVVLNHAKGYSFLVEEIEFQVLFQESLEEMGWLSSEWRNEKEYPPDDLSSPFATQVEMFSIDDIPFNEESAWEGKDKNAGKKKKDKWYDKYNPFKEVPKKLKIYPELRCN